MLATRHAGGRRVVSRAFAGYGPPRETRLFPAVKRLTELTVSHASGCEVFTTDGARYLDFTAGIGALSTGHCHPTVTAAVVEQAGRVVHAQQSVRSRRRKARETLSSPSSSSVLLPAFERRA